MTTNNNNQLIALQVQLEALQAENVALKAKTTKAKGGMKVSPKGGLSVYGLGRFPVTLYESQWEKLIAMIPEVVEFIKANEAELRIKDEK